MGKELFNLIAEQELLGSLLIDNSLEAEVSEILQPEHFGDEAHADIYRHILESIQKGTPATATTLQVVANNLPSLEKYRGGQYLKDLVDMIATTKEALHHARLLRDLAQKRILLHINSSTMDKIIARSEMDVTDLIDEEQQKLFELGETQNQKGFVPFEEVLNQELEIIEHAFKHTGEVMGLSTGMNAIDQLLGGIQKTDLVIIAGRPSMGKTALVTTIAYNVAKNYVKTNGAQGTVVGIFSLEMSKGQLVTRLISRESGISSHKLRHGQITDYQFSNRLLPAIHEMRHLPIYIDDSAALSIGTIRNRARWLKRTQNLGLLIVDYLQLAQSNKSYNNRVTEVSEITQGLKGIAKDLEIPVIALSQLSRNVEQRDDKRPQLADLRESGSIEQDADVVGFIYREEYYLSKKSPEEDSEDYAEWQEKMAEIHNKAEFIVSKQRNGPTGTAMLYFDPELTTFCDLDKQSHIPW